MSGNLPDMRPLTDHQRKLVESVMPMIHHMYRRSSLSLDPNQYDEFLSFAHEKLCTAVKAYDPKRGSWSTLAGTCILRHMKEWAAMARMDISRRELRILRSVASGTSTRLEDFRASVIRQKTSLDDKPAENYGLLDTLESGTQSPEEIVMGLELRRLLDKVLARKSERDREVILSHVDGQAYSEIAERLGISRERVRQIHADVREKLRKELHDDDTDR